MCSDLAVKVDALSKSFHIYSSPRDRLKQFLVPRLQNIFRKSEAQFYSEFWALKNVTLEVKKGETVGIIGRNGSGKSTLLQIICGTLNPSAGTVVTNGRIGALLELGTGFNPDFTGRENVYMNATVLGLSMDEINNRLDDILSFADIGEFIDQPVKVYSSGMLVRLAFAVQAQIDPDILIVDEALAVGDARFQAKCFERLKQLKNRGTSILLVTHSSDQIVNHCSHAILLERGEVVEQGQPRSVVNRYLDILFGKEEPVARAQGKAPSSNDGPNAELSSGTLNLSHDVFYTRPGYNPYEYRWGDGAATVLDYCLIARGQQSPSSLNCGDRVELLVSVRFNSDIIRPIFGFTIKTKEGVTVYGTNTESLDFDSFQVLGAKGKTVTIRACFDCSLAAGDYFISLGIASKGNADIIPHDRRYDAIHFQVMTNEQFFGLADLNLQLKIEGDV